MYEFVIQLRRLGNRALQAITHLNTDFDEIFAAWMISRFGDQPWLDNWTNGRVELGVGKVGEKGVFNEHDDRDTKGDKSNSCATLIAESLGLREHHILAPLLEAALAQDAEGLGERFDIFSFIKGWRKLEPRHEAEIFEWTFIALDAWYGAQKARWDEWNTLPVRERDARWKAHQEIGRHGVLLPSLEAVVRQTVTDTAVRSHWESIIYTKWPQIEARLIEATANAHAWQTWEVARTAKGTIRVGSIISDDPYAVDGMRKTKMGFGVIIHAESNGCFQVFGSKGKISLVGVLGRLAHLTLSKRKELSLETLELPPMKQVDEVRRQLARPGKQLWTPDIYWWTSGPAIFNGSLTTDTPGMIGAGLTMTELKQAVIEGIKDELGHLETRKPQPNKPADPPKQPPPADPAPPTPETPEPAK